MDNSPLNRAESQRRGRPPGAKNKRSLDLARYVVAQFGGMTPGQQTAALCMVTALELRTHGGDLVAAMIAKARHLAAALDCEPKEAWLLLSRERTELMAYVHQRQPQAAPSIEGALPTVFVIPEGIETGQALLALRDEELIEFVEEVEGEPDEDRME